MNKNIIIGVIVVLVIIGGIAVYAQHNSSQSVNSTTSMPVDSMESSMPTDNSSASATSASSTNNASVDATVTAGVSTGTTKEFTVDGSNFKFDVTKIEVNKGDHVKITFVNTQGFHDFVVDGYNVRTKQIQGGQQDSVEFTADKAGSFEYYCSVGNHRAMGMKGTLIVK